MSSPRIPGNRRIREPATTLRTITAPVKCSTGRRRFASERTATMHRMPGSAEPCTACGGWHLRRRPARGPR